MLKLILILIITELFLCAPNCKEGLNSCTSCNPITKLCVKCDLEVLVPDENGGCKNSQKCVSGENNCLNCNQQGNLCEACEEGYFPDENGGCSYTDNCELSYKGKCLKCKDNFIYVGLEDNIQICKSLSSEDLKNCFNISIENGKCGECEKGFFLNEGDKKCTKTENCYESSFGICKKCSDNYYLNKKEEKCIYQLGMFKNCRESLTGEVCDICNDNYYPSKDGKCSNTNFCSKCSNSKCKECVSGYYLSEDNICTTEENCKTGKKDIGVCLECKDDFAIDFKDGKCKSNKENNEFAFCKFADESCKECEKWYYLGEDNKCSITQHCAESEKGLCVQCSDNYYLGKDNKCTDVEHCIYSDDHFKCEECEGNYCYNEFDNLCFIGEGILENCKFSYFGTYCTKCKDDYYINQTDYLCRSNSDPDYLYKCAKIYGGIELCTECVKGYYLGKKDNKCSKIEGCEKSENENKCLECNELYSLDLKTGSCEYNQNIDNEEKKFYYRCNRTNAEGTACEICMEGYKLSKEGLCVDIVHCEDKDEDGNCIKCIDDDGYNYCLNKDFGCIDSFYNYCLECNNLLDLYECTKCDENHRLDEYGRCI